MFNNNSMGPADFAAMSGGGNWGFGGDGIWGFFLIALLFGMWGGNGFFGNGWGGNNSGGAQAGFYATQADLQRGFDQAALTQQVASIATSLEHDMRDPGYMITNSFAQAELSRANNQAALMAQINNNAVADIQNANMLNMAIMGSANQEQANTAQIRYDMATSDCAIKTAIEQAAQQIMLNDNANYRSLHDEMIANQIATLNETIRNKDAIISDLRLAASQANQNQLLIDQLRPAPVPAYPAPNPYSYMGGSPCMFN